MELLIPVSAGELFDKLTILAIKAESLEDPLKLARVREERAALERVREANIAPAAALDELVSSLAETNRTLWDIEDAIRAQERAEDFGARFIELARAVYRTNDRRCALKQAIDRLVGSDISEQKSYEPY